MSEPILKHKKISHVVRETDGEQETDIREEKISEDGSMGFIIHHSTTSIRCSCGRERVAGQGKTYVCQTCKKELCENCFFGCIGGDCVCADCMGLYRGQPVCPAHWRSYEIEKLYSEEKRQEDEQKRREAERIRYEGK
ncbi:MAG: hypothetical protein ABH844_02985 [Candidatus Omnitrophota bacterium]